MTHPTSTPTEKTSMPSATTKSQAQEHEATATSNLASGASMAGAARATAVALSTTMMVHKHSGAPGMGATRTAAFAEPVVRIQTALQHANTRCRVCSKAAGAVSVTNLRDAVVKMDSSQHAEFGPTPAA